MLPTAIVFGFNFPAVTKLIAATRRANMSSSGITANSEASGDGAIVGLAYSWNTLGAIVGAIAAGFWLLPKFGGFHLLAATAAVNAGLAVVLSLGSIFSPAVRTFRSRVFTFAGAGVSIAILIAVIGVGFTRYFYDPAVATFNTLLYWNAEEKPLPLAMRDKAHMVDVVYWADGLNSTISIGRTDNMLALRTNGKVDASNNDITTQLMLGHIGAIAHRTPRRVLVIGFGAGMTLSALARYPEIERLDCVEIEPDVVRAAPLLTSLNRDVLKDPRVHMIYDDGRNFLFTTHEQYDLIVSEPSNPWIAGIASLFTREFYRTAQEHLTPGGIFVQWVHCYSLYPDDLRMVFATFLSQFHGATLWHGVKSDLLLVAPTPPVPEMLDNMRALWTNPQLHSDFNWMGIEKPEGIFGFYMLDDASLRTFAATGRINTDDRTLLEYSAPRSLLVRGLDGENLRELYQTQKNPLPDGISGEVHDEMAAESATTALNSQNMNDADRFVAALGTGAKGLDADIARGRAAIAHKDYDSAAKDYDAALASSPDSIDAAWGRAEVNRLTAKLDLAHEQLLAILQKDPANLRALASLEQLYGDTGHSSEAADTQRQLIAANPRASADDYAELGEMLKRAGKLDDAITAMKDCLARDPYNFQTNLNLGQIYDVQKKYLDARRRLEFVQRFFPDVDSQTYSLLYEVDTALGDSKAAADAVHFGLSLFPNDPDLLKLDVPL
jgi:tetratricopeptide (TPR) repeat protein